MGPTAIELVAGVIDQIERAVTGTGRPSVLTVTVLETLRFFLREGVQWRELRASPDPPMCGRAGFDLLRHRVLEAA